MTTIETNAVEAAGTLDALASMRCATSLMPIPNGE